MIYWMFDTKSDRLNLSLVNLHHLLRQLLLSQVFVVEPAVVVFRKSVGVAEKLTASAFDAQ